MAPIVSFQIARLKESNWNQTPVLSLQPELDIRHRMNLAACHFPLFVITFSALLATVPIANAQPAGTNYDESKVPKFTLPDPLILANGKPVTDAATWTSTRRPEILKLFQSHEYGKSPGRPANLRFETRSVDNSALEGKAVRKQISALLTGDPNGPRMEILIYLPKQANGPVPAFLGLNFSGNHSIHSDPGIRLSTRWMRPNAEAGIVNNQATEASRGSSSSRWPVEKILARGYGLATVYYGDIEPDFAEGWKMGIRSVYPSAKQDGDFAADDWGAIGAWAWGLSRVLDYFETDTRIDQNRIALLGHSRLGKTSLWAGAQDERFGIVISNNSGCGGAALNRRHFGETVQRINTSFPHWFCQNFKLYNENEDALPLDQHMLIALVAPRPVYVASAEEDQWADPRGEFLSALNADPVYRLLGKEGLGVGEMPRVNTPVGTTIGYHIRTGKHDVTDYDWDHYLSFADRHFERAK